MDAGSATGTAIQSNDCRFVLGVGFRFQRQRKICCYQPVFRIKMFAFHSQIWLKRLYDSALPNIVLTKSAAIGVKEFRWICVKEQIPQAYERVLVYDPTIPMFKSLAGGVRSRNNIEIGFRYPDGTWLIRDGGQPTHWCFLPDAPNVLVGKLVSPPHLSRQ